MTLSFRCRTPQMAPPIPLPHTASSNCKRQSLVPELLPRTINANPPSPNNFIKLFSRRLAAASAFRPEAGLPNGTANPLSLNLSPKLASLRLNCSIGVTARRRRLKNGNSVFLALTLPLTLRIQHTV